MKLLDNKCGTTPVMEMSKSLSRNCVQKSFQEKIVVRIMQEKVNDARIALHIASKEFECSRTEYYKCVKRNSLIDEIFQSIKRNHVESIWKEGRDKNQAKLNFLLSKWKTSVKENENIRNVKYSDADLEDVVVSDVDENIIAYGNVEVSENVKSVLGLPPKLMTYNSIDLIQVETEIQKGLTKARYNLMNEGEAADDDVADDTLNLSSKTINYSDLRATKLPTVQHLIQPKPAPLSVETSFAELKDQLMQEVRNYQREKCNKNNFPINSVLKQQEMEGIREIKTKVKNKEFIVGKSDKSGQFTVDSLENYHVALSSHVEGDEEITPAHVKTIENKMNDALSVFNKIFSVGEDHGDRNVSRVTKASTSTDILPPVLYDLRKTHKAVEDQVKGPKVRPVCAANTAPNSRLSHFLSMIINDFMDAENHAGEVRSSEEMRALFDAANRQTGCKKKTRVVSQDVKGLYPAMSRKQSMLSVIEMIENSGVVVKNVNVEEAVRFIAVMFTPEEIKKHGLENVIPAREKKTTRQLTINCLKTFGGWLPAACVPNEVQKQKILALVVAAGVDMVFANHCYRVGDKFYLQTDGGPIGLELAGAV